MKVIAKTAVMAAFIVAALLGHSAPRMIRYRMHIGLVFKLK